METWAQASFWFEGLTAGCLSSTPQRIPKGIVLYQNGKCFLMCCQDRHYKLPKDGFSTVPLSSSTGLLISWRTFVFSENRLASLLLESIKHGIWPEQLVAPVPLKSESDKCHLKRGILTRTGSTPSLWFKMWKYGSILKQDNLYEFFKGHFIESRYRHIWCGEK